MDEIADKIVKATTQNVRCTHDEKAAWEDAAARAGHTWEENGVPRGNVSRWLRELANKESGYEP